MDPELVSTILFAVGAIIFVVLFMAFILLGSRPVPPQERFVTLIVQADLSKWTAAMDEITAAVTATSMVFDDAAARMREFEAAAKRPEWAEVAEWDAGERAREAFLETAAAWPGTIMITLLPACPLTQFTTVENLSLRDGEGLLVWCNRSHLPALEEAIAAGTLTNTTIMGKHQ